MGKFYVTYNKGRGQGKGLIKSSASNWKNPQVFKSYHDAEEYIGVDSDGGRGLTAYWVSDDKMNRVDKYGDLIIYKKGGEVDIYNSLGWWLLNTTEGKRVLNRSKSITQFKNNIKKELPISTPGAGKLDKLEKDFDWEHLWKGTKIYHKGSYAKGGKTKEAKTWKEKYNKKYGFELNKSHSLSKIAKKTGVSKKGIQKIYNKGIGAYKTNPQSVRPNVKSKEQWAYARVYSSVMGGNAAKVDAKELKMAKGGEIKAGGYWTNKKSKIKWELNWVDKEDKMVVLVKGSGKPLTKRISIKSLLKNWEPPKYAKGGSVSDKRQYMAEFMADLMPDDYLEQLGGNATYKDGVKWELENRIKTDADAEYYGEKYESSYITGKDYEKGGEVYRHKHIPTMTFEITGETSKGYKGIQKDKKSLSKLERTKGKKVSYSSSELKDLFEKDFAKGGEIDNIQYKGKDIMYEPHFKEYYVDDSMFESLSEAKEHIDKGSPMDAGTIDAYKKGLFTKGGKIEGLKNEVKEIDKVLENTESGGEDYAVLQEEKERLERLIRKSYAKGGETKNHEYYID